MATHSIGSRRAGIDEISSRSVEGDLRMGRLPSSDRYAMLGKTRQLTLIVHGNKDIVVIPINAFVLEHLPDAQLVMYPDASPGAQSQHAEVFLEHARPFLSG
jgi:pimeloyl-ACP methyl ester carboxylesterase